MTIQRTGYRVTIAVGKADPTLGTVTMEVVFKGKCEDRGDALLMIADAWSHAMKEAGFDPIKAIADMEKQRDLH